MKDTITLNDNDRRQWVKNDEPLYVWWRHAGIGLYRFVRENRSELSDYIMARLNESPRS